MPTITDSTVVASANTTYESCRPQLLSNGWIVTGDYNGTTSILFQVDKRDGAGFIPLCSITVTSTNAVSIISKGTLVYVLYSDGATKVKFLKFDTATVTNTDQSASSTLLETVNSFDSVSINLNKEMTEVHAIASVTMSNNSLFNIHYYKGIINTDNTVTFGPVENVSNVVSTTTTGPVFHNASIIVGPDNIPIIIGYTTYYYFNGLNVTGNSNSGIMCLRRDATLSPNSYLGAAWTYAYLEYQSNGYNNPSIVYTPKEVNGLANGRFHVVYSKYISPYQLIYAYSDDLCKTWNLTTITTGTNSKGTPTISVNVSGNVFIVYVDTTAYNMYTITNTNGTWGASVLVKAISNTGGIPTSLVTFVKGYSITSPLFIYRDTAKVGFYGTWSTTMISITEGGIGTKTSADKASLLTYSITTDGTMSTITEKLNGTTISTKTATSGQSLIVGLTQAQWDAIIYGKYADATGGLNTLTVSMNDGSGNGAVDTWTYTFDKRLATTDDINATIKAAQDNSNTSLPANKALLGAAIRNQGGTVNDTDSLETMASVVSEFLVGKKFASGQSTMTWNGSVWTVTITGLLFTPDTIVATSYQNGQNYSIYDSSGVLKKQGGVVPINMWTDYGSTNYGENKITVSASSFTCTMYTASNGSSIEPFYWMAYGS